MYKAKNELDKTERNPKCIKLKFNLKDEDHMSDDE